jgi:drug/metabolite transporter, DME family
LGTCFGWGILFFLGVAPTLGGFGLYTLSMRYLPHHFESDRHAGTGLYRSLSYLFLQEIMTGVQLAGRMLLLLGVILLRTADRE